MRALLALVLVTALTTLSAPAQPAGLLSLKNPRLVYGMFGQDRKDAKLLAGDIFWLAYDIDGLQAKEDGKVFYSIAMELLDSKGKSIFKQAAKDLEAVNSLGGGRKPAFAYLEIGTDTPPGKYTINLTVTDRLAKATKELTTAFEVLPPQFGFVRVDLTMPELRPTAPIAVPGQELWLNFTLAGFDLDAKKKQPHIDVKIDIVDAATGKAVLAKPSTGEIKEVEEKFKKFIPWNHPLFLNRAGKFKVKVEATDNNSKQKANLELDFQVLDLKN